MCLTLFDIRHKKVYLREGSKSFFVVVPNKELANPMLHPDLLRQRFVDNPDVNAIQQ